MAIFGNVSSYEDVPTASSNSTPSSVECFSVPGQATIVIHVFALFASLMGNSLLITAFVRMKEKVMLVIASMAASDLLVAIFLLPRFILAEVLGSSAFLIHGGGGTFLCKMCSFLSDMSLSVTTLSLIVIAVERFLAVVYPLLYMKTSSRRRRLLVASTWIMAAAFHSPYFYMFRLVTKVDSQGQGYQVCSLSWEPAFDHQTVHQRYSIFLYTTVLILPLLVIFVLYAVVAFQLRKDKLSSCRNENGTKRIRKRTRSLLVMAIATVLAFLICWTLHIALTAVFLFSPWLVPKCSKIFKMMLYLSHILASCYCAINPWICLFFIPRLFRELKVMVHRRTFRRYAMKGKKMGTETESSNVRLRFESRTCSFTPDSDNQ
ncbi:gonadotropin-releasing hormone receptor-like [Stylophora pistillata]|uniref:gonadotropin-releasing hormone receptor-like n=1 Tax=Stylophora pistillata TaxID=50429 RepID=UPI000C052DCD|nr:gonadotropin-releasing hormone receptor-like [Stylophora pistillata]XP_022806189.1 gonadotropin-releasing hormone receptor-like [Stylophora pistillata]